MGLYGVAKSCVKTVMVELDPVFCQPNLKGYGHRYDGRAIVQAPSNSNGGLWMGRGRAMSLTMARP